MKRLIWVCIYLIIRTLPLISQVQVGQWRDHLPYNRGKKVVLGDKVVYLLTDISLMKYDISTGEVEKMSKITGLSDAGAKTIAYSNDLGCLAIGYADGNLDLVFGNKVVNINDIKRKAINGDKSVYCIAFDDKNAYLGCGFGIVVVDIAKLEIAGTWMIGWNSKNLKINELDIDGNFIYAATERGVYRGDLQRPLADFSQWDVLTDMNCPAELAWIKDRSFNSLRQIKGKTVVHCSDTACTLVYDGSQWKMFPDNIDSEGVTALCEYDDNLIICKHYGISFFHDDFSRYEYNIWQYNFTEYTPGANPADIAIENADSFWIADSQLGLVHCVRQWSFEHINMNGPAESRVFMMSAVNDKLVAVGGGKSLAEPSYLRAVYYEFADEKWTSYSEPEEGSHMFDFVAVAIDPTDNSRFFCGSWVRGGLVEFRNGTLFKQYSPVLGNTTIEFCGGIDPSSPAYQWYIRVGGLAFDKNGNLWVTNSLTDKPLHVMTKDGKWYGFNCSKVLHGLFNIGNLIITPEGNKWILVQRGNGLLVVNENSTFDDVSDDKVKKLRIVDEEGASISDDVYSIAEDKDGYIWVGTSKGVVVYYRPQDVFDAGLLPASQIKIPRNNGTNEADILLVNEYVTAIAVDGGNNKWFGTQNNGVYYTSADGLTEIHHFTTGNSPLLSDNILDIKIMPNTGEVFFATSAGIISYRGAATEGADDFSGMYAFPNPVPPDYSGPITITGLVADSYVTITDIAGNLVYEAISQGGQAVWNGKTNSGNDIHTGIYVVLAADKNAKVTGFTKILFIDGKK